MLAHFTYHTKTLLARCFSTRETILPCAVVIAPYWPTYHHVMCDTNTIILESLMIYDIYIICSLVSVGISKWVVVKYVKE